MPHELKFSRSYLPPVEDWPSGDSQEFQFHVKIDGVGKDLTDDDLRWEIYERPYDLDGATPLIDTTSDGVDVIRTPIADEENGEFRIRVSEGETSGEWGRYYQVVTVDPPDETKTHWVGPVIIEG